MDAHRRDQSSSKLKKFSRVSLNERNGRIRTTTNKRYIFSPSFDSNDGTFVCVAPLQAIFREPRLRISPFKQARLSTQLKRFFITPIDPLNECNCAIFSRVLNFSVAIDRFWYVKSIKTMHPPFCPPSCFRENYFFQTQTFVIDNNWRFECNCAIISRVLNFLTKPTKMSNGPKFQDPCMNAFSPLIWGVCDQTIRRFSKVWTSWSSVRVRTRQRAGAELCRMCRTGNQRYCLRVCQHTARSLSMLDGILHSQPSSSGGLF